MSGMHASIWEFRGDPGDLATRYDALMAEMGTSQLLVHLCLTTPDGLLVVDTCPDREAWRAFRASPEFPAALARHGLPEPVVRDHPVHAVHVGSSVTV